MRQAVAPPPLSGGTLLVAHDGHTAVAADPERDRVLVVDLANPADVTAVALASGDEPGRLAEDGAGRVHVALRAAHALATIDLATRAVVARRDVCPEPRGVAYDPAADLVHVACAGGELVSLPAAGGDAVRTLHLESDLRDVLVRGDTLWVSTFRAAGVLRVARDGSVTSTPAPSSVTDRAHVAWRLRALPSDAGVVMLHQRASLVTVAPTTGGYGQALPAPIVLGAFTTFRDDTPNPTASGLDRMVLPLDFDVAPDGSGAVVIAPGNWMEARNPQVMFFGASTFYNIASPDTRPLAHQPAGQAVAVAYDGAGRVVVQTREPAALEVLTAGTVIPLGGESRADTGHTIFHSDPGGGLACASCHPEGREDGHVWTFRGVGPRRTQFLRGGVLATAPFHWSGELPDATALVHDVFSQRMSGGELTAEQIDALGAWIDAVPRLAVSPPADADAVARGDALFHDAAVGCATCHAGTLRTNNATVDVGTGGAFQVPALRDLALRAPYMHNGCAATLRDRFDPTCGGVAHGNTGSLTDAQRDDLIAYLQTL